MQTTIFDISRKVIGELRQERTSDSAVLLEGVKALEVFGRDYCTVCMDKVARLLNDIVEAGIIKGLRGLWCRGSDALHRGRVDAGRLHPGGRALTSLKKRSSSGCEARPKAET